MHHRDSAPRFRRRLLPLSILLATGGLAMGALHAEEATPQEAAAQAQGEASTLGTVTVTSRRREENSQDVPTAMSVLGGETLESQRIYRVQDLQQLFWRRAEVITRLKGLLDDAFQRVMERVEKDEITHRVAAMAIGVQKVDQAKTTAQSLVDQAKDTTEKLSPPKATAKPSPKSTERPVKDLLTKLTDKD